MSHFNFEGKLFLAVFKSGIHSEFPAMLKSLARTLISQLQCAVVLTPNDNVFTHSKKCREKAIHIKTENGAFFVG